jgi:hypothetical protein
MSKLVYASAVKDSEKMREKRQELIDASMKERKAVRALMLESVNGKRLNEAEALAVVQRADALGIKEPLKVLEQYNVVSGDQAVIVEGPSETRKVEIETEGLIAEGRGRTIFGDDRKAVTSQAQDLLRATGRDLEFEMPADRMVADVTFERKAEEEDITRYKPEQMPLVNRKTGKVVDEVRVSYEYGANGELKTNITTIDGKPLPKEYTDNPDLVPTKNPSHYAPKNGDTGTGTEYGTFSFINPQTGETDTARGRFNVRTGLRQIWSIENNKHVDAPADYTWEGALPTKSEDVTEDPNEYAMLTAEAEESLKNNAGWPSFKKASGDYVTRRRGARQFADMADLMAPYAQDRENYSVLFTSLGALSSSLKTEAAGLSSLFPLKTDSNGNPIPTEIDARAATKRLEDESLSLVEALDSGVLKAAEIANTRRKLMQNIAMRMAIAEIQADNESRPSDFDVKSRLEQYQATSPLRFAELIKTKSAEMQISLENDALAIQENPVYTTIIQRSQSNKYSPTMRDVYTDIAEQYAPVSTPIEGPKFLQDENALNQFSDEDVTKPTAEADIQVPLNVQGITKSSVVGNDIVYTFTKDGKEMTRKMSLESAFEKGAITQSVYDQYTSKD